MLCLPLIQEISTKKTVQKLSKTGFQVESRLNKKDIFGFPKKDFLILIIPQLIKFRID